MSFTKFKTDKDWFQKKLKEMGRTQEDLAEAIFRSPSTLSRMLDGQFRIDAVTLGRMATFLKISPNEIIPRLGGMVRPIEYYELPVVGGVNRESKVEAIEKFFVKSHGNTDRDLWAVQVQDHSDVRNGWLLFYTPTKGVNVIYNRLYVIETAQRERFVAYLKPGKSTELFDMVLFANGAEWNDVKVLNASPIVLIKPFI